MAAAKSAGDAHQQASDVERKPQSASEKRKVCLVVALGVTSLLVFWKCKSACKCSCKQAVLDVHQVYAFTCCVFIKLGDVGNAGP